MLFRSRVGATLHCVAQASYCGGFSCCGAWALGARASVVAARGLSSCGSRASLLRRVWDLPGPGLKPVSPALAGRFLTTTPPGKSSSSVLFLRRFDHSELNGVGCCPEALLGRALGLCRFPVSLGGQFCPIPFQPTFL